MGEFVDDSAQNGTNYSGIPYTPYSFRVRIRVRIRIRVRVRISVRVGIRVRDLSAEIIWHVS